ncbi:unnamed protein product [Tilletia controversa]|uniref:Cryptic loci regulator 2 N-terminal domain-containing protein n=1 Tax=Tilletia controversa TaxID=13291 RepID=A0A8X7MXA7_9BASI|nr:hypothetical protein CF328_g1173 [Tilletia controversa]KAE8253193.1 hypothetical protein A4X06_0g1627 [Tilletia controversa]CAD6960912.1 unnamed protein product [Tilletia controversa]CAD6972996.1 unnamed protein product [Tilletia controversa]CAD6973672.1 unnamed protein product [Tilletia controversa]
MAVSTQDLVSASIVDRSRHIIALPRTDAPTRVRPRFDSRYHVKYYGPNSTKVKYWERTVGGRLAQALDLLPPVAPGQAPPVWRLAALPEGYHLAELYEMDSEGTPIIEHAQYSTVMCYDPSRQYLTPLSFVPHALWLCLDPNQHKCKCVPCTSKPYSSLGSNAEDRQDRGIELKPSGTSDPWTAYSESWDASAYRRVWASDLQRQAELEPVFQGGKVSQALRYNELVWFQLPKPLLSQDRNVAIAYWPAHISRRDITTGISADALLSSIDDTDDDMSVDHDDFKDKLDGNVVQDERYRIQLLGIRQETVAPRSALFSQLGYRPPPKLLKASTENVPFAKLRWLRNNKRPKWQLSPSPEALSYPEGSSGRLDRLRAQPSFDEALPAYYLAVCILSYLCTAVVGSKPFTLKPDLALTNTSAKPTGTQLALRKEAMESIRSSWIVRKRQLWPEFGPLNATFNTIKNTYFQGVMLGGDRIWAADVIRLELKLDDLEQLKKDLVQNSAGVLDRGKIEEVMKLRRAFLMDLDAIVYPDMTGSSAANRNLLFCGSIIVALHRQRDADLIKRLGPLVRSTPYSDPTMSTGPGFSLEWTRPRTSMLYTGKLAFSPDMVFVPLVDTKKGFVAALPLTLIAGRWHPSPNPLAVDRKGSASTSHSTVYTSLMGKLDQASSADAEIDLTPAERALVLEGWAPGGKAAMACQHMWESLTDVHDQAERAAKVEVCEMLEMESEARRRRERVKKSNN